MYGAYLAANTTTLRIGTAALLLPIHHPLIIAEELATLDLLSNGRLEMGFSFSTEQYVSSRLNIPDDQLSDRCEEQIEIISMALRTGAVEYQGKYYRIENSLISPRPIQKPVPPIWIVVNSERSLFYSKVNEYGSLTRGVFNATVTGNTKVNKTTYPAPHKCERSGVQAIIYIAKDQADSNEAKERAREAIAFTLKLRQSIASAKPSSDSENIIKSVLESHALIGAAEEVLDKIIFSRSSVGFDRLICNFCFADIEERRVFESMNRFAEYVMPTLKHLD